MKARLIENKFGELVIVVSVSPHHRTIVLPEQIGIDRELIARVDYRKLAIDYVSRKKDKKNEDHSL